MRPLDQPPGGLLLDQEGPEPGRGRPPVQHWSCVPAEVDQRQQGGRQMLPIQTPSASTGPARTASTVRLTLVPFGYTYVVIPLHGSISALRPLKRN